MLGFRKKYIRSEDIVDAKIALACLIYYIMSAFNSMIKTILPDSSIVNYMSLLSGIVILWGYSQCITFVFKRNSSLLFKSFTIFSIIYFFSAVNVLLRGEPINLLISGTAFLTFAWCIPLGVFSVSIKTPQIFYDILYKGSFIITVILTLMFLYHPANEWGETGYSMFFGYSIILPILLHTNEFIRSKKLYILVVLLGELMMMMVYASRGCWLCFLFFIVYKIFFDSTNKALKIALITFFFLFSAVILFWGDLIILYFASLLESLGLNSRTLALLASGAIADGTGRDEIWAESFRMIAERPIFGWGLGGEYYHLAAFEGASTIDNSWHSHNGLIQNIVCLGVMGGFIANIIFIKPFLGISKIRCPYLHDLILIFGSSIVSLFYSSSGFFITPAAAIFTYLYYFSYKRKKI